ncbi:MAG TPA: hypothetical protein VGE41_12975 [Verrucomicrobiae bacterium]
MIDWLPSDLEKNGNLLEAGIWLLVTLVLLTKVFCSQPPFRRIFFILSAAFFIFGISDIIESRTGAWWRPWWLFVMKASCVLVFYFGFRAYYQEKKREGL